MADLAAVQRIAYDAGQLPGRILPHLQTAPTTTPGEQAAVVVPAQLPAPEAVAELAGLVAQLAAELAIVIAEAVTHG